MPPKAAGGGKRAVWRDEDDKILIYGLSAAKKKGLGKTGGWPPKVWTPILKELNEAEGRRGIAKTATNSDERWHRLKKSQKEVEFLRNCSGFGWDSEMMVPTATDEVWEALVERTTEYDTKGEPKKNRYIRWRDTPFPLYDEISFIVTGKRATGERHFIGGGVSTNNSLSTPPISQDREVSVPLTQSWSPSPPRDVARQDEEHDELDDDDKSQHMTITTDPLGDLTPSSPVLATPTKRPRSESVTPVQSNKKRGGKRTAEATFELAEAMRDIARAVSTDSPQAKRKAVQMAMDDGFEDEELPYIQRLLTRDSDVARIYSTMSPVGSRIKYARNMVLNP
ncbi:hypothetical protein PQX77_011165 [Marasmius sp. AFHP31]|nr:hypothetical protein PQX77_011165 [Marasmius sp. AFHP31]